MKLNTLKLEGTIEITPEPRGDNRGYFMRTYDLKMFTEAGAAREWVQENQSRSTQKGIVRGLHFQFPPYAETKLVRCIRGKILDVFVDLRKNSKTFGEWDSIELSEENKKMVYIPRGFAHGFCTLTEDCEVLYKVDNYYAPEAEGGLLWNDPKLGIPWPVDEPVLSDKDKVLPGIDEFVKTHKYISL